MDAIAYGAVAAAEKAARNIDHSTEWRQSWFKRFIAALKETRRRQAERELRRHAQLLPYSLDERGDRLVKLNSQEMPFGGWWAPPT